MQKDRTKKVIFWVFTIAFPFFILALFELTLSVAGYDEEGENLFIEYNANKDFLVTNPKFVRRYFPSFKPSIAPKPFKKEKSENTFRVFVFGGSSTIGFPYNFYYSFSGQLEQMLLLNTDGLNVEIINLGMTAVNSYVIRDLSERVIPYDPDAVIIYAGHNEYYGSFGVASTQFGLVNSLFIKRLVIGLKEFRLYRLLENILKSEGSDSSTSDNRTLMAKVISESNIEKGNDIYEAGIQQYQNNIGDVLDSFSEEGIPVYIGTLASNLKDQKPLGDNVDANLLFEKARQLYNEGRFSEALDLFEKSKELDDTRFRAPEALNQFIIKSSEKEGIELVNTQKILREASSNGIEDNSLFTDHLHPNTKGHMLMAEVFFKHLKDLDKVKETFNENSFGLPETISQFEETFANTAISRLLVGYPFQKGVPIEEELSAFQKIYNDHIASSYIDSIAAVTARENKFVPLALTEIVNEAKERNDSSNVISHYYELLKWQLNSIDLIEKGIEYSVNQKSMETYLVNMLVTILNDGNRDPRYMDVLSSIYLLNYDLEKAKYWLDESERSGPNSQMLLYNLGRYHILKGDTLKAGEYYNKFLQGRNTN